MFRRAPRVSRGVHGTSERQVSHFWFWGTSEDSRVRVGFFPRDFRVSEGFFWSRGARWRIGGVSEGFRVGSGSFWARGVQKRSLPVLVGNLRTSRANFEGFRGISERGLGSTEREALKMVTFGFWGISSEGWANPVARGSGGFRGFPEGGLGPSGQEGFKNGHFRFWWEIWGLPERISRVSERFPSGDWVLPSARRSKWSLLVSEDFRANFDGFWGISEGGLGSTGQEGFKNGDFRFWREIWGLPERISRGCERFPREDWVLPGARG